MKPRLSRRKEIIKIKVEINDIETKNTVQEFYESRSWFFKKLNKIDKFLTELIKKKRERTQINNIRKEREETTDITEILIQRTVRKYYEQLHAKKLDSLVKWIHF